MRSAHLFLFNLFKMSRRVSLIYQLLFVFQFIHYSCEIEYEYLMEDGKFYNDCKDLPAALTMEDMLDLTNLNLTLVEDGIQFSGNMTAVWPGLDISDRVQMAGSVHYFDRGTWVPTILNMLVPDFCRFMYDDKQLWYKPWSSHIINHKDIVNECIKVPGTVFVFETYTASFRFGSGIQLNPGRYLIRVHYSVYDKFNQKRPTEACFEMRGEFFRVKP